MRLQRAQLRRFVVAAWVLALEWPFARVRALVPSQIREVRARVVAAGEVANGLRLHTPVRASDDRDTLSGDWPTGFSPVCRRWWRRNAPLSALRYEHPGWEQTNGSARRQHDGYPPGSGAAQCAGPFSLWPEWLLSWRVRLFTLSVV